MQWGRQHQPTGDRMASLLSLAQFDSAPILPPGVQPGTCLPSFTLWHLSPRFYFWRYMQSPSDQGGMLPSCHCSSELHDSTCPFWVCSLAFLTQPDIPEGPQPAAGWAGPAAVPSCAWCLPLIAPLLGHRVFAAEFMWLHPVVWLSSSIAELSQFHLGLVF